ncbi:hypothetical protein HO133_006379 [Letharia lupina]|uniref:Uncharacterized protein n=1 Tax=Letharia lupina TaxID=560253 RepID=A0A8H6C6Q3_9LECA|nr:uncharacterized protein HO133_006379 [Letharia lupina]KAF6217967.1 hypothetical protein HO133_006379 [Letharia lupina]
MLHVATSAATAGGQHGNEMHPPQARSFPAPTPFGTLIIIPIELRLKIYRLLIERGQSAVLRTSRATNEEAFDKSCEHAVCRLAFNCYLPFDICPSRVPWGIIQNLELRVQTVKYHDTSCIGYLNTWLPRFSASMTNLKTCKIRLDFGPAYHYEPEIITAIKTLVALQKMTLAIAVNADQDAHNDDGLHGSIIAGSGP